MVFAPKSLRQKLIIGYLIGLSVFLGVIGINIRNLFLVEDMIIASDRVSDFFETTLEIRRFEKNYLLYKAKDDYFLLTDYLLKAENMLETNGQDFQHFISPSVISGLKESIVNYRGAWEAYLKYENWESRYVWEEKMRETGREIVTVAEGVSKSKSKIKQATIRAARNTLIVSISMLVLGIFSAGLFYYQMLIRPIVKLERHMNKITSGEFSFIPIESNDRELVSLNNAFNRMLMELDARQKRFIFQSEKLALLGTMVSGVAHQLNNPLSNISTSCQILAEELDEANGEANGNYKLFVKRELLEQVDGQVERAKEIIKSLLEFSRKKEFKNTPLPLALLMEEAVRLLKCDMPSKIEVNINVPEDIWIFADKQRIMQALLNILKNAADAIPEEGSIDVSAMEDKEKKQTVIKIKDTGIGIEPEYAERIFEPFFTTKPDGKGSGLGLFVAREIIEDEDGYISVESSHGEGTTFTINLPVKESGWNTGQKS